MLGRGGCRRWMILVGQGSLGLRGEGIVGLWGIFIEDLVLRKVCGGYLLRGCGFEVC